MSGTQMRDVVLMAAAVLAAGLLVVAPLVFVFVAALSEGLHVALSALADPEALAAIRLTLAIALPAVAINTVFGALAAWTLARFRFRGRDALMMLIELPVSVTPVVGGLVWLLLFGAEGWFGPWLAAHGLRLVFAWPGMLLATLFVTFPYVVRVALPLLESQGGAAQEEAAMLLGAGLWSIWWRVTLPGMRAALLSGVLLTTARALGEFGAVSVVSGHIPGLTNTMPLEIEALYNGYRTTAAFSMSAALAVLAMALIGARSLLRVGAPAR